jgi:hypothetical protein
MQLETTLRELELAVGREDARTRRDPELYYVALFGKPEADSVWGWRFEGHHLSVNVTSLGSEEQTITPLFMGANPARIPSGPRMGVRILAAEEDLARELLALFTPQQFTRVILADTTFGDIITRTDPKARPLDFAGLPVSSMTREQQAQFRRLLNVYLNRMPLATAREHFDRIQRAGFARLHFAWAGSRTPGQAHYYRIHGPSVLVEYDNTQSDANHVHTVWRDLENDFGGDRLRQHYAQHPHSR